MATDSTQAKKSARLSVDMPEELRRHWTAEAKRQGTTVKAVVMEALKARFGEPKE